MSDKKLQSSRRNGALSRKNPLSPELSHKVAMNAVRHGLNSTTAIVVLANESEELFNKLHESFIRRHRPADEAERDFVRQLAFARWRLRRITTLETALFDLEMDGQVDTADDTPERRLALGSGPSPAIPVNSSSSPATSPA
jgi:hypothetical protein